VSLGLAVEVSYDPAPHLAPPASGSDQIGVLAPLGTGECRTGADQPGDGAQRTEQHQVKHGPGSGWKSGQDEKREKQQRDAPGPGPEQREPLQD